MHDATGRDKLPAYPHLVPTRYAGNDWTILECEASAAATHTIKKELYVPRAVLMEDALVRMHELWHIKRTKKVPYDTVHADGMRGVFRRMVEEIALEKDASDAGMQAIYQARDALDWINMQLPVTRHDLAAQWLQLAGSIPHTTSANLKAYFAYVETRVDADDMRLLRECLREVQRDTGHLNCEKWADVLTAQFAPKMSDPGKPKDNDIARRKREEKEREEREQEEEEQKRKRQVDQSDQTQDEQTFDTDKLEDERGEKLRDNHGRMLLPLDVHKHTSHGSSRTIASQWRASTQGTILRYPHRLYPSGRVFGVKQKGGSILVDFSGSMAWEPEKLDRLIKELPGVWVGGYDGHSDMVTYSGRLCIIAQAGRVGERGEETERSGGNYGTGADLAAIEYAMRFAPKPLVIVTDGECGPNWKKATDGAMRRYRLHRVATFDDAVAYLQGKQVWGYRTMRNYSNRALFGGSEGQAERVRKA